MGLPSSAAAEARMDQRISFDFWFALIFIVALHGTSVIKILPIMYVNYQIAKRVPKMYMPAVTWIFNICMLFSNELYQGYKFVPMIKGYVKAHTFAEKNPPALYWAVWLDRRGGLIPRWEVLFNITVLRLISFNIEYYWSLNLRGGSPIEVSIAFRLIRIVMLMQTRRSSLTLLTSVSVIAWPRLRNPITTPSATTLPMRFTRHCIWLVPFSPSTITLRNPDTEHTASPSTGLSATQSDSSSVYLPWNWFSIIFMLSPSSTRNRIGICTHPCS